MTDHADEPLLLTPGPIAVSRSTKEVMLRDCGSRDGPFIAMTERVQSRPVELVGGATSHVAVLLQGSGTYAEETSEDTPPDAHAVASRLASDEAITHVAMVYCETTSGMLNPLSEVAGVVAAAGRLLLVDAMSAFGALPCDVRAIPFDGLAASFNKCLEGVPGAAFVICRRSALENAAGNAHSLALDLHDQWTFMERTGQWRFTPPTHVIAACDRALTEHAAEGGVEGRGARYRRNCAVLIEGMRAMGFTTLLPDALQAPIIVTFHMPADPRFEFQEFYENLRRRGYIIYPGKLTTVDSFRIGCIGHLDETDIRQALTAIRQTLEEMGVRIPVPAASR
ncbi:MAG: 2-aminoethylphosphonate--pyruvate transaminase [Armatimonadetes bacterium]|nr:2-aminoethylphosphonate--pyruvate transaminase [Armatimonadota bacterium]